MIAYELKTIIAEDFFLLFVIVSLFLALVFLVLYAYSWTKQASIQITTKQYINYRDKEIGQLIK